MAIHGVGGEGGIPREVSAELLRAEKDLKGLGQALSNVSKNMMAKLDADYKKAAKWEKKEIKAKKKEAKTLQRHLVKNLSSKKLDYVKLNKQVNEFLKLASKQDAKSLKGRLTVLEKQLEKTDEKISDHLRSMITAMKKDVREDGIVTSIFKDIFEGEAKGLESVERNRYEGTRSGYEEIHEEVEVLKDMGSMIASQREQLARARSFEKRVNDECGSVEKQLINIKKKLTEKQEKVEQTKDKSAKTLDLKKGILFRKTRNRRRLQKMCFWGKNATEVRSLKKEIRALEKEKRGEEAVLDRLQTEISRVDERLKQDIQRTGEETGKVVQGRADILNRLETGIKEVWEEKYATPKELAKGVNNTLEALQPQLEGLIEPTRSFIKEVADRWKIKP